MVGLFRSIFCLFRHRHYRRLVVGSGFILLCLILLLRNTISPSEDIRISVDVAHAPVTSTKWWIRMTATSTPSILTMPATSDEPQASNCSNLSSSLLQAEKYAYIALKPPLPNRIRASANLSSEYLGQIKPGAGLKVIDGPICADGYAWWLVESLDNRLRGWTVEGKNPQQWIILCPAANVPCSFTPTPISSSVVSSDDNNQGQNDNTCRSDKLSIGIFAQVAQDSLLVIRVEPSVGEVLGHAGPISAVRIIGGPSCAAGTVWWKVNALDLGIAGWTTETYLEPCPKDSKCNLELFQ